MCNKVNVRLETDFFTYGVLKISWKLRTICSIFLDQQLENLIQQLNISHHPEISRENWEKQNILIMLFYFTSAQFTFIEKI